MAMKTCSCGRRIDKSAKFCPGCGKPRSSHGVAKLLFAIVFVPALLIFIVLMGASHEQSAYQPPARAANPKAEASFQFAVLGARQLRGSMRNPGSFELSEVLAMPDGAACYEYRAQNGFGGMSASRAVLTPKGTLLSRESVAFAGSWNKECANKTAEDQTELVTSVLVP